MSLQLKYIDIHTHKASDKEVIQIVDRSGKSCCNDYEQNYFSIGLHPWHIQKAKIDDELIKIVSNIHHKSFLAIGECGLDKICATDYSLQLSVFKKIIAISEEYKKPLILHVVKSYNEIIELRKDTKAKQSWIIHGFSGSSQLAAELIKQGFYLSFGKHLIIKHSKAAKALAHISMERVFFETDDSDFLIHEIFGIAAKTIDCSLNQLQINIAKNFKAVFNQNLKT